MKNPNIDDMIAGATPRPTNAEEALRSVSTRHLTKAPLTQGMIPKVRKDASELLESHCPNT